MAIRLHPRTCSKSMSRHRKSESAMRVSDFANRSMLCEILCIEIIEQCGSQWMSIDVNRCE